MKDGFFPQREAKRQHAANQTPLPMPHSGQL
jgi:hypothetical protein